MENNQEKLLNHYAVHLKRTQYCKSTILQLKKKSETRHILPHHASRRQMFWRRSVTAVKVDPCIWRFSPRGMGLHWEKQSPVFP